MTRTLASLPHDFDIKTSVGFLVALVLFPLTWAALTWLAWRHAGWPGALAAIAMAPLTGAVALRWLDRWHAVLRATWGLWTAIALPAARGKLRRMRARIIARVERLIERWKELPRTS
jgi:soluble lytic murein transglycosylase-like protein